MCFAHEGEWTFPMTNTSPENGRPSVLASGGLTSTAAEERVSESAKGLVSGALKVDLAARLSADALLSHEWLRSDTIVFSDPLPDSVVAAVRARAKRRKDLAARHLKTWSSLSRA